MPKSRGALKFVPDWLIFYSWVKKSGLIILALLFTQVAIYVIAIAAGGKLIATVSKEPIGLITDYLNGILYLKRFVIEVFWTGA